MKQILTFFTFILFYFIHIFFFFFFSGESYKIMFTSNKDLFIMFLYNSRCRNIEASKLKAKRRQSPQDQQEPVGFLFRHIQHVEQVLASTTQGWSLVWSVHNKQLLFYSKKCNAFHFENLISMLEASFMDSYI